MYIFSSQMSQLHAGPLKYIQQCFKFDFEFKEVWFEIKTEKILSLNSDSTK